MTPLALFLIACATVFLGSIQAAFSLLMRLSLRLMAERGGRSDRLGRYLDDPLQLFIPVRILIGLCTVLAGVLIAGLSTVSDARSVATFFVSLVAFVVVCEHLLPMLVARRDPEEVLDVLLPAFHPIARADASDDAAPDRSGRRANGAGIGCARRRRWRRCEGAGAHRRSGGSERDLRIGGSRTAAVDRGLYGNGRTRSDDAAS